MVGESLDYLDTSISALVINSRNHAVVFMIRFMRASIADSEQVFFLRGLERMGVSYELMYPVNYLGIHMLLCSKMLKTGRRHVGILIS